MRDEVNKVKVLIMGYRTKNFPSLTIREKPPYSA